MSELKFHAIKNFVNDLGEIYSTDNHPLALYDRLLQKTTIAHTEAVDKHISAFTAFYTANKDVILSSGTEFTTTIQYSPKVFIDMTEIYRLAGTDGETKSAINSHLLAIASLLDPQGGAKEKLKELSTVQEGETIKFNGGTKEDDFLNEIIGKVEKVVSAQSDDTMSASDAFSKVMSSGLVNEIISGIGSRAASGNLDIGKMLTSVQKTMGDVSSMGGNTDPQFSQMMNMMNMLPMFSSLGKNA